MCASFAIFNPLLKCALPFTGHFFCLITSVAASLFICIIYRKECHISSTSTVLHKFLSVLCAVFAVLCTLLLMTQVIRDTCFIVGRGVSTGYYFLLSLSLLTTSFALCSAGSRSILRFCCISAPVFMLFTVLCFLPFTAVKGISHDILTFQGGGNLLQSALCGIVSGLMLASDTAILFYCAKQSITIDLTVTKITVLSVITAFFLLLCQNGCVYLIFGRKLTLLLAKPVYALTKCFKGFDLTEIVPAAGIFAFIAKCSVYLGFASSSVCSAFGCNTKKQKRTAASIIFLAVPAIYLPFLLSENSFYYGSLQHLIYPLIPLMSLFFIIKHIFEKK